MKPQFTLTKNGMIINGTSTPEPLPHCLHNGDFTSEEEIVIEPEDVRTAFECVASYGGRDKTCWVVITSEGEYLLTY